MTISIKITHDQPHSSQFFKVKTINKDSGESVGELALHPGQSANFNISDTQSIVIEENELSVNEQKQADVIAIQQAKAAEYDDSVVEPVGSGVEEVSTEEVSEESTQDSVDQTDSQAPDAGGIEDQNIDLEIKNYEDGTTATGTAPLPDQSPTEHPSQTVTVSTIN